MRAQAIHAGYSPPIRVIRPRAPGVSRGAEERAFARDIALSRVGIRGLGDFCDNSKAQAGVGVTLALLQSIGGAMAASGSGKTATAGKTGAGLVSGVGESLTAACTATQGQAGGGATSADAGNAQMQALFMQQQQQTQMLAQQQNQQMLDMQRERDESSRRTQTYLVVGGVAAAAIVAVVLLRR